MDSSVPTERMEQIIHLIRGHRVILDADLAKLYGVASKALNQAVKRNRTRFPRDFMFQLTAEEAISLRSQIVTLKAGRGRHRKYRPYVFTEQGIAMLSSVLRSERARASDGYGASSRDRREPSRDWRVETRGKETYS